MALVTRTRMHRNVAALMLVRIDRWRFWLFGIAIVVAVLGIGLETSGQYGVLTHAAEVVVPLIIVLVLIARGAQASRLVLAAVVSVPVTVSAIIGAFIQPGYHPEVTALLVINVILVFIVGFPLGLYSDVDKSNAHGSNDAA